MSDIQEPNKDAPQPAANENTCATNDATTNGEQPHESQSEKKRKRFGDDGLKFGRGGKRRDMGRNEWQ